MRLRISGWGVLLVTSFLTSTAGAGPEHFQHLKLEEPMRLDEVPASLQARLQRKAPPETVIVRLQGTAATQIESTDRAARMAHMKTLESEQGQFMARWVQLPGVRVLARVQSVMNAVFLEVDADMVPLIEADPMVTRVAPVSNYQMTLSETVPYIGGTAVQNMGFNGAGVRIAVLDSGVDYLHANLGGAGDPAEYAANDPTLIEEGTFPTAKVVGGFDFVGDVWPNGPLAPDPDPLDLAGHGTHVADIIGGEKGVAPGVDLYAVSVCSSVASSCSGVALIQGMEFAVDPNGDGDTSDHVDIINMSLGSDYGTPFDDDLSFAVENASALGVLTVSSAGNGGDRPYVSGTPAGAVTALSVAQTQVPSAKQDQMDVEGVGLIPAVFQAWSAPLEVAISGPVQYADGAGGNLNGCLPFEEGSLAGQIVLVDRGACNFTTKIFNIGNAGGALGIIGLIAPGEPFNGGFADPGGPITIPGFMISLDAANLIRSGAAVDFDPANAVPLVGSMVASSSRGPTMDNRIKPEIGAPGASVSAETGTGTGETPFGGTSGASPMVAGSAALLLEARGVDIYAAAYTKSMVPLILKSMLVNNGETGTVRDFTGVTTEITRIGGGEVRVDRAATTPAVAYSLEDVNPTLSLGFNDVSRRRWVFRRTIKVRNLSKHGLVYRPEASFRFANDENSGAVSISVPSHLFVPPKGWQLFTVRWEVDGEALGPNPMTSGGDAIEPANLTAAEFDGYITLAGEHPLHLPWHIIPRQAADVRAPDKVRPKGGTKVRLSNVGVGVAQNETFTLAAISPDIPRGPQGGQAPTPDLRAVGSRVDPVPAGFCSAAESFVLSFAFNTHERQAHLLPVINAVNLDLDRDGTADFEIAGLDVDAFLGVDGIDGRILAAVTDLETLSSTAFFFAEHATNTGNTVLRACAEQLGLTAADLGTRVMDAQAFTFDYYFGGPGDSTDPFVVSLGGERYQANLSAEIAPRASADLEIIDAGASTGDPTELGVLVFTNTSFGPGNEGGATEESEALLIEYKDRGGHGHSGHSGHH